MPTAPPGALADGLEALRVSGHQRGRAEVGAVTAGLLALREQSAYAAAVE